MAAAVGGGLALRCLRDCDRVVGGSGIGAGGGTGAGTGAGAGAGAGGWARITKGTGTGPGGLVSEPRRARGRTVRMACVVVATVRSSVKMLPRIVRPSGPHGPYWWLCRLESKNAA